MSRHIHGWLSPVLAWALMAAAAPATESQAALASHRLADWVSGDLGLCLEISDLPRHWASFSSGPLAERLWAFPPVADWRARNPGLLSAVRGEIARRTGVAPSVLLNQLLGREVLFAIWPPSGPTSGQPNVLLLAEALDGDLMRQTLRTLVSARKEAGKWRGATALQVAGETFAIDTVAPDDDKAEFFITSADRVAIIATSEAILRDVLRRRADPAAAGSLAKASVYGAARERLPSDAAGRLFVNPRAWDAALRADLQRKPPGSEEARSQQAVVAAWAATDYVAGALRLDRQLNVELAWQWRAGDLPPALREVAMSLNGAAPFADKLPNDSLAAFALHADLGRIARMVIAREWKNALGDSKKQGESILAWALVAGVGSEVAGYLKAPSANEPKGGERWPLEAVAAVQTRPLEPDTGRPALVHQFEPLMHAWLSAAVAARNHQREDNFASIKTENASGGQASVTVVSGIVPGYRRQELAYRVDTSDRLWIGTSARLLTPAAGSESPLAGSVMERDLRDGGDLSGVAYVNLAAWRELAERGREAVDFLWHDKRLDERTSEQKYRELQALAQLADRLLVTSQIDSSTVHLSLSLIADAP